jgi:hypothetical protein
MLNFEKTKALIGAFRLPENTRRRKATINRLRVQALIDEIFKKVAGM